MKFNKKLFAVIGCFLTSSLSVQAQNNVQITQSLIDEYHKYSEKAPFVFTPGSNISEKNLLPKNSKDFTMKVEIFKNDKQILMSHIDVPNSTYTRIFNGNSLNKNKKETESSKLNNQKVLIGESSQDNTEVNSLEIGIVVNKKKNSDLLISQIWIEKENNSVNGHNKTIKPPKGTPIAGDIEIAPNVDKYIKEISVRHKDNSKAITFFEDYKIEITPI